MAQSISETLAHIREEVSKPVVREIKYNAQGFEIRHYEPLGGNTVYPAYPNDSQEKMMDRFQHEDTVDPS